MLNKTVREIIGRKPEKIWSITSEQLVYDAIKIMAEKDIGALPVLDKDGKIIGIVSERDCLRKVILQNRLPKKTCIRDIMTTRVVFVTPEQPVEDCMALMVEKNIRHLPVLENEELISVLSVTDTVRIVIEAQKFIIKQIEHYISGSG